MKLVFLSLLLMCFLLCGGCYHPPHEKIEKALNATNELFRPLHQEPIKLSSKQADTIKRIVRRFKNRKQVRIEKENVPLESGAFILDDIPFFWFGNMLCLPDREAKRFYI